VREAGRKLAAMIGDESVYFQVSPYRRARETLKEILLSSAPINRMPGKFKDKE
jgi:phosphohistidine phosphatase SixA